MAYSFTRINDHIYMMDNHGELLELEDMKKIVQYLSETIAFEESANNRQSIAQHNRTNDLAILNEGNHFKSNYPVNQINLNRTKMTKSNMRKTSRPYVCENCFKEFQVREGEYRYWINTYDTIPNPTVHFEPDRITGSCCSKECLIRIAHTAAVNSIDPDYKELFNLEFLLDDVRTYVNSKLP